MNNEEIVIDDMNAVFTIKFLRAGCARLLFNVYICDAWDHNLYTQNSKTFFGK